ncbi:MAG: phenylacetate--CoA ligase family protein [Gammaproteobacteria bacterium]|nr:phenylacetate--CoA ligase family protein [Gammaproteobacteria bacterium]MCK5092561.1 phenylacetate--CoA ligase family protein [Gammaproteobacteria bacterium]
MRLKKLIGRSVILPLYDRAKGTTICRSLSLLEKYSTYSRKEVQAYQLKRVRELLRHAYDNVPFYRKRLDDAEIQPENLASLEDMKRIPALTRDDIQNAYQDLMAQNMDHSGYYQGSSSGSTGEPVRYMRDPYCSSMGQAARYFGWSLSGWEFGKRYLTLWGNPTIVAGDWKKKSSILKSKLFSESKFPAFTLVNDESMRALADLYMDSKFDYIQGYTNAIFAFAEYIRKSPKSFPRIQGVLTTAETLQAHQRKLIEEQIGPVYDFYGCGEINGVAFQCKERSDYHIIDPHVYLEYGDVMDDEGNRELIITDLDNFAMPLIRYANGDMGKPGANEVCLCGLEFSRLGSVSGRISDVIRTPGGGTLSVPSIMGSHLLKELHGLLRYQAKLVEKDRIIFKIQVNDAFSEVQEALLRSTLGEYLDNDFSWDIEYCEKIIPQKNGKYKLFIDSTLSR